MTDELRQIVKEISPEMRCNCDLDNWQPTVETGHSTVCRIHRKAMQIYYSRHGINPPFEDRGFYD